MNYEEFMRKYIKYEVPLDIIQKQMEKEIREIETLEAEQENSSKELNIYKYFYGILTIFFIIILILSVNFNLK